ncbi:MAG: sulfotransferase domain-containing protein [Pseudomonadota bacterium]
MNKSLFLIRNIGRKFYNSLIHPENFLFYLKAYIVSPLKENEHTDAYIVSYPKCGRTWLRVMYVRYMQLAYNLPSLSPDLMEKHKEIPNVNFTHDQGGWVPAPVHFSKIRPPGFKYYDRPVIFIVRDPRDVLISSYMHLRYRENLFAKSISEFIRDEYVGVVKIIHFYNEWVKVLDKNHKAFFLTYEDMHESPVQQLAKVLQTIGLAYIDRAALESAVEFSRFDNMKKMEKNNQWDIPWLQAGKTDDERSYKTRQGKVGEYRNVLNNQDIDFLDQCINEKLSEYYQAYRNE